MSGRSHPPNRRVAPPKRGIVDAPEERIDASFDESPADPPPVTKKKKAAAGSLPPDPPASGRWVEALRTAAGVVLTIATALAFVWGLVHYTRTSPRFAIRTVDVVGGARRTPEDVMRTGAVVVGRNIFTTDLEQARRRLVEDPWIERATLSRRLPSTVKIEIVEREAAAMVALGSDLYLATRDGEMFKKLEAGDPFDLPVVTGVLPGEVAKDRPGAVATVKKALDLASEYGRIGPSKRLPVEEVHVEDDGGLVLVVGKEGIALRVGKGPYRTVLEQGARVLAEAQMRRAQPAVVFLDNEAHPERVVVRMR